MNGKRDDAYRVEKHTVDLDLTEVLGDLIDDAGKQKEKYTTHMGVLRTSGQQIELTKALAITFSELAKIMPKFYQKRIEDHRSSFRLKTIFSFLSASSIEKEATKRAREDVRALMDEVSMLNNETMRSLVEEHTQVLKRLCDVLIDLMKEERKGNININVDALKKFIEGQG